MVRNNTNSLAPRRPAIWLSCAFMAGIALAICSVRNSIITAALVLMAVLLCIAFILCLFRKISFVIFLCSVFLTGAFLYTFFKYNVRNQLPDIAGQEFEITATVANIDNIEADSIRYEVKQVSLSKDGNVLELPYGMMVTIYGGEQLLPGDRFSLAATVRLPRASANDGTFDYREYLANKGVYFTAYAQADQISSVISYKEGRFSLSDFIARSRLSLADAVRPHLSQETFAIFNSVITGDQFYVSDTTQSLYQSTGIAHVLSISGLHVGFLYSIALFLTKGLHKNKTPQILLCMGIIWIYIAFTGFNVPAARAGIFFTLMLISKRLHARYDPVNITFVTALILLMCNPLSITTASFQLSFCAVLGIALFSPILREFLRKHVKFMPAGSQSTLAVMLSANVGVLIPLAYHFNSFSVISLVSNLFVVPLFSYITIFGFVLIPFALLTGGFFLQAICTVLNGLVGIADSVLRLLNKIPYSTIAVPTPHMFTIIAAACLLLVLSIECPRWIRRKTPAALCCLAFLCASAAFPYIHFTNTYTASFLDVGQAECSIVVTPQNKVVMIDAGEPYGSDSTAEYTIAPYLYNLGYTHIDWLIVSHNDTDHIGAIDELAGLVTIRNIVYFAPTGSSEEAEILSLADTFQINAVNLYLLDSISVDKSTEIQRISTEFVSQNANDTSLVAALQCGDRSLVFTGDASASVLDELDPIPNSLVYKVPHHGSKTSLSDFFSGCSPQYSIIFAGENNVYHFPSQEAYDFYSASSQVYVTGSSGCITIEFHNSGERIKTYK